MSDSKLKHGESAMEETGFNEAELQDIMNEIETLEKEFAEVPAAVESKAVEVDESVVSESLKVSPELVAKTDLQKQIEEEMNSTFEKVVEESSQSSAIDEVAMAGGTNEFDHVDTEMMEADEILGEVDDMDLAMSAEPELEAEHDNVIEMNAHSIASTPVSAAAPSSFASKKTTSGSPVSLACEGNMTLSMNFKLGDGEVKLNVHGEQGVTLSFSGVEVHMTEDEGCVVEMNNGVRFQIPLAEVKSKKNVA